MSNLKTEFQIMQRAIIDAFLYSETWDDMQHCALAMIQARHRFQSLQAERESLAFSTYFAPKPAEEKPNE